MHILHFFSLLLILMFIFPSQFSYIFILQHIFCSNRYDWKQAKPIIKINKCFVDDFHIGLCFQFTHRNYYFFFLSILIFFTKNVLPGIRQTCICCVWQLFRGKSCLRCFGISWTSLPFTSITGHFWLPVIKTNVINDKSKVN